jgi:hypothetical protein
MMGFLPLRDARGLVGGTRIADKSAISRETQAEKLEAAKAYAGLDDRAFSRLRRRHGRKVEIVEFILMWRDEAPAREIADRFALRDINYVSAVRKRLGLPPREQGGRRG